MSPIVRSMIYRVVKRFSIEGYSTDDLFSEGLLCAVKVAQSSRAPIGSKSFNFQVKRATQNRILDLLRVRSRKHAAFGPPIPLDDECAGYWQSNDLGYDELVRLLRGRVAGFDKRLLELILSQVDEPLTFREIARSLSVTPRRVQRTLEKLGRIVVSLGWFSPNSGIQAAPVDS